MKKLLIILLITSFTRNTIAQKANLDGIWKLTETVKYGEQSRTRIAYITFKDNGTIEVSKREIGTWQKNESKNIFSAECFHFPSINGDNIIETLDEKLLKLKNANGEIVSLQKIGLPKGEKLNNKYVGEWLLGKVEKDGESNFEGVLINLNSKGIFYVQGYIFGEWNYNKKTKKLFFDVKEKSDPFNGKHSVLKSNKSAFTLGSKGAKMYFSKIDKEKITKDNKVSGLTGSWEIENKTNSDEKIFISFKTPDEISYVVKTAYSSQKGSGMWIFNKNEKSVILLGRINKLGGLNSVVKTSKNEILLKNNGTDYVLKKVASASKIEHLTYSQEDFYTENEEYKYDGEDKKLPWNDSFSMMMTLVNVKQLVYKHSTLIEGVNIFQSKIVTANVNSNPQEQQLSIDYIFNGYDRFNLPKDTKLPPNQFNEYNKLYPEENNSFRVVGKEKITTSAGTFNCTIVEVIEGFDKKLKLWMINDKPYIFAKMIKERTDKMYGYYHMYELQEIK